MNEVFLDTSYAIAMLVKSDAYHQRAVQMARDMRAAGTKMVTSRAVLFEIGNSLARARHRQASVQLLEYMEQDRRVEIAAVGLNDYLNALDLYRNRSDKEWGLVDCASFILMTSRGLTDALTADEHFEQAGFRALLRSP